MDRWILCDFHIHTNMSDGNLSYGEAFDAWEIGNQKADKDPKAQVGA